MSDADRREAGENLDAMLENPPWYAQFAPNILWKRTKLLGRLIRDYYNGDYREVPYATIAAIAAALVYVVSPIDLIPDVLIPIGWTDDMLVVAILFQTIGLDLSKYVAAKRLNPAEYGFDAEEQV